MNVGVSDVVKFVMSEYGLDYEEAWSLLMSNDEWTLRLVVSMLTFNVMLDFLSDALLQKDSDVK